MSKSDTNVTTPAAVNECRVLQATVEFHEQALDPPLVLSSGPIHQLTEARARVTVRTGAGEAQGTVGGVAGMGSIYLSDLWAWPEPSLSHSQRDEAMRQCCRQIARELPELTAGPPTHPLELGLRLHERVCANGQDGAGSDKMTALAQSVCLSPFDAAIHDAVGRSLNRCAMRLYDGDPVASLADAYFDGGDAFTAIGDMLAPTPRDRLRAWVLVGKGDHLDADVKPWFTDAGYSAFKLKLMGREVAEDVARTAEMHDAAVRWGCAPMLSVDTNENCPDADFVRDYLTTLEREQPQAFAALAYLEQPTARDISEHRFDWHGVSKLKPILLDEGLTSLPRLRLAAEQGWSGLALKTCKGHSFTLTTAAWACRHGLTLAMQDLTNPGLAAIHSALVAAYLPTINGVELNSPQFTPKANAPHRNAWPGLFDVSDGYHRLTNTAPVGLGTGP